MKSAVESADFGALALRWGMRALWLFAAATLVVGRDRDEAPVLPPREQTLDTAPSLDAYATNATLDAPSYSRDADGLHRVLVAEDDALSFSFAYVVQTPAPTARPAVEIDLSVSLVGLSYVAGGLAPEMRGQGVVSVDDAARLS